jgi:hypothetical protein
MVDEFLAAQNLKLRDALLSLPAPPDVRPPSQLSSSAREEFRAFLILPSYKAFAVSSGGHYAYAFGRRTEKEAQKLAEEHCKDSAPKGDRCALVVLDESKPGS